jgi:hypothetical protein
MWAGSPATSLAGGTSRVTSAPAATKASAPISMPGRITTPLPIRAPRRMIAPLILSWRASVRPMRLSLVVVTQGAMKTWSSSSE